MITDQDRQQFASGALPETRLIGASDSALMQIIAQAAEAEISAEPVRENRLKFTWLEEVPDELPEREWVIDGMLPTNCVAMISGKPGSKKTWLGLWMALCVARGSEFLGYEIELARPALWIDEESGDDNMKRRLNALVKGMGITKQAMVAYTPMMGFDACNSDDMDDLKEITIQSGAKIIFLDTFSKIFTGDENSKKDIEPVFRVLRKAANDLSVCFVLLHHPTKAGATTRGSGAIEGDLDVLIPVESEAKSPTVNIKCEKGRNITPFEISAYAKIDIKPGRKPGHGEVVSFAFGLAEPAPKEEMITKTEKRVIAQLDALGASSVDEIMNAAGCSRSPIYAVEEKGLIKRTNNPKEKEAIYDLTSKGAAWCNANLH
jgi:hypothetical protein